MKEQPLVGPGRIETFEGQHPPVVRPAVGDTESQAKGSGARFNADKVPFEMIPMHLLAGAARVFHKVTTRPVNPYPLWNWAKGMPWLVPYACIVRHLSAWFRGERFDPDTGESHLDHLLCNVLMLIHYEQFYPEGDNRPTQWFAIREKED